MYKWDAAIKVLQDFHVGKSQARGFHFQRNDFYSLLNDLRILDANRDLWHKTAAPLDIDWNLDSMFF